MKPKLNYKEPAMDRCQTPSYALDPLLPFLPKDKFIWEPACGKGNIVHTLGYYQYCVSGTDIIYGQEYNFFNYSPPFDWDVIITNPPYSLKYQWLAHCYSLGKPFALLMPVEMIGAEGGQLPFEKYGVEIIYVRPRINFYMPNTGYANNGAQFPTAWYCWKLNLGAEKIFRPVPSRTISYHLNFPTCRRN